MTGDLIEIYAGTVNAQTISSVSGCGGTFIDSNMRSGNDKFTSMGYVYPATSTAGPCVVTFSATSGGAKVGVVDWTVAGGTPALDATCDILSNSGLSSPFNGCSMTLTGTGDGIVEGASSNATISAVSSPWSSADALSTTSGIAAATGLTSGFTAPAWTSAGVATAERMGMAFGFTPTPCVFGAMMDSSGGSNGAAPTLTTLQSSTFGATGTATPAAGTESGIWSVGNAGGSLTYATAAHQSFLGPVPRFCNGGTTYSDDTLGLSYSTTGLKDNVTFKFPYSSSGLGVAPIVLASTTFVTTHAQTDTVNCDCFGIYSSSGAFALMLLQGNGTVLNLNMEGATGGTGIDPQAGTVYHVALEFVQNGTSKFSVYDSTGVQLNTTQTIAQSNFPAQTIIFGNNLASAETAGHTNTFSHVQFCYVGCTDADFPYGIPVKVATPTDSPGAGTYSNTATVTLVAQNSDTILYTTDGSTPACPSTGTTYSGGFAVTTTSTVKAIGCSNNAKWVSSAVMSSVYTITTDITTGNPTACATPGVAPCTSVIGEISTGTNLAFNLTIPTNSGNHPGLVVNIIGGTLTGCTYNGVAMTQVQASKADGAGTFKETQYILINPTTGSSKSLSCNQSSSGFMHAFAQPVFGVNQTGTVGNSWRTPPTATNDGGSGTSTATITVTTVAGDFVIDCQQDFSHTPTVGTGIAQVQLDNETNLNGSNALAVSWFKATGVSTVMTWTFSGATFWSHSAIALIPG